MSLTWNVVYIKLLHEIKNNESQNNKNIKRLHKKKFLKNERQINENIKIIFRKLI